VKRDEGNTAYDQKPASYKEELTMGIYSNTVSICQFNVAGDFPEDLVPWITECLQKHSFNSIEDSLDEQSIGWVHTDDHQNSDFINDTNFKKDNYALFTLRRDQRKIPAALLKAYQSAQEQNFLNANPGFFRVPKHKREELRDAVKLFLFGKTLPSPATYDVVWDLKTNVVTFTSLSPKTIDVFETEFKKTFPGLRLVTLHPYARAEQTLPEEKKELLEKANLATTESALDLIRANQWIGKDFLLWLLYGTLNGSGEYKVRKEGHTELSTPFVAYLNDRIVLQAANEAGKQKITVAGAQDQFNEVLAALRDGKQITEATIYIEKDENLWRVNLKGELFYFGSFKSPSVQIEKEAGIDAASEKEAVFFERMYLLETGIQLFDSLFMQFLTDRLENSWHVSSQKIQEWYGSE